MKNKCPHITALVVILFLKSSICRAGSDTAKKDYKNLFYFSGTDYYFKGAFRYLGVLWFWKDDKIGVYYSRKINNNAGASIGYNQWNSSPLYHEKAVKEFIYLPPYHIIRPGSTDSYYRYKMLDVMLSYCFWHSQKQFLTVEGGATYTWGKNFVIDSIYVNPAPPYDYIDFGSERKRHYFGLISAIRYDLIAFKRIYVGADVRYRYYFTFPLKRIEYGIHTGLRF